MSDDIRNQYIAFLKTARPESIPIIDQVLTWITEDNILQLTTFFAQNNNSISKALEINYWKLFPDQDALLTLEHSYGDNELKKYSLNPDGTLNPQDILFPLLYHLLPFDLHPRMQEALWNQYAKEWGQTWKQKEW